MIALRRPFILPCALLLAAIMACTSACARDSRAEAADMAELWAEPPDVETRDLFLGPGGRALVPDPESEFRFVSEDTTGHTGGYDVTDPQGRTWDVKIGDESRPEMVASRILWAIGYHQPVTYFVPKWRMAGGPVADPLPGRFRLESDHRKEGEWSWHDSPFVGTKPHRGLLIVGVILNGWDYTSNNNRVYVPKEPAGGPARWLVVQDLGATLGRTRWPNGTIDDLEGFLSLGFVEDVRRDGTVKFDYHGRHRALLRPITVDDVVWTCRLLSRLSEPQLRDAFRAASYPLRKSGPYVDKIQQKIQQGLALKR